MFQEIVVTVQTKKTIKQGVSVFRKPDKWLGSIVIDPLNGTIEDTIPEGLIDPIKNRIIDDLRSTRDAYSESLYVLYRAAR